MTIKKKKKARAKSKTTAKVKKKVESAKPSRLRSVKRTTKKMVDDMLLKVNPQVQKQLDQLKVTLEKTPTSISDLKMLGLKVLERARNLSQTLRAEASHQKRKDK